MEENYILKDNLSIKNMRELSKFLIKKEAKKDNLEVEIYPVTTIEWYKTDMFKKKFKLQNWFDKFDSLSTPLTDLGENYGASKTIYLFLNTCQSLKLVNPKHAIIDFIHTTYHELAHNYQRQHFATYNRIQMLSIILSDYIINHNPNHYNSHHDDYFEELDANLYAIKKTEIFLKKYPNLYHKHKEYIDKLKDLYEYQYNNYSFNLFFDEFHQLYQKNPQKNIIEHTITEVFYKENTSNFKSITEIINHKDFNFFAGDLFTSIITSKSFLNELNLSNLNYDEIIILTDALKHSISLEIEKQKRTINYQNNHKNIFDQLKLLHNLSTTTKRIKYLEAKLNTLPSLIKQLEKITIKTK